jgi:hypothetical protein
LVEGCACKPAPWSAEEAARHQGYAVERAQRLAGAASLPGEAARTAASEVYAEPREPDRPTYQSRWRREDPGASRYGWR